MEQPGPHAPYRRTQDRVAGGRRPRRRRGRDRHDGSAAFSTIGAAGFPANFDAEGRFWRELARLEGTFDASGRATGGWTCAPLDIDQGGYVDTRYTAFGSWELIPAP